MTQNPKPTRHMLWRMRRTISFGFWGICWRHVWSHAVWPDWAIFDSSWRHNIEQKWPKLSATNWAILKNMTLMLKQLRLLFGQLLDTFRLLFTPTSGHTYAASRLSHVKSLNSNVVELHLNILQCDQTLWLFAQFRPFTTTKNCPLSNKFPNRVQIRPNTK